MKDKLFSPRMKMADLIGANHNLILMMPRFKIPFGFGEKRVCEICERYSVPVDFLLMVCNAYTFNDYRVDEEEMAKTDMTQLVPYLKASHDYYLNNRLPHIGAHLRKIVSTTQGRVGEMLSKFFSDYCAEISEHFQSEEKDIFPHILQLQNGGSPEQPMASRFVESHTNIEDKLADLTQIIYKYLPSTSTDEVIDLVYDMTSLSADLGKHQLIEEKILIPYVHLLEGGLR